MDDPTDQLTTQRKQIAETRNELETTIGEIHGRLNPTVLKEEAMDKFHEATQTIKAELKEHFSDAKHTLKAELREAKDALKTEVGEQLTAAKSAVRAATIGKVENMAHQAQESVRGASRSVVETMKANPVPTALVGLGLAWMFVNARRARMQQQHAMPPYGMQQQGYAQLPAASSEGIATAGAHKISELAHGAGRTIADGAHGAASTVASAVGGAAGKVSDVAGSLAHGVADGARNVGGRVSSYYEVNPLAIGAVALAVGAVVGFAIPITKTESKYLGAARDTVVGKANELAQEAIGKAEDMAQQLGEGSPKQRSPRTSPLITG